jgi:hypothetical protein
VHLVFGIKKILLIGEGMGGIISQRGRDRLDGPNSNFLISIVKIFCWVGVAKDNQNINFFAPGLKMIDLIQSNDN